MTWVTRKCLRRLKNQRSNASLRWPRPWVHKTVPRSNRGKVSSQRIAILRRTISSTRPISLRNLLGVQHLKRITPCRWPRNPPWVVLRKSHSWSSRPWWQRISVQMNRIWNQMLRIRLKHLTQPERKEIKSPMESRQQVWQRGILKRLSRTPLGKVTMGIKDSSSC